MKEGKEGSEMGKEIRKMKPQKFNELPLILYHVIHSMLINNLSDWPTGNFAG